GRPRGALARRAARVRGGAARRPVSRAAQPSGPALPALRALSRGPRARVRGVTPITIASYNIHRGVGLDRRRDLDRIGIVIAEMNPDVVGLQEVIREDGNVMSTADQAAYLASKLGMELVMGDFNAWHRGPVTRGLRLEFASPMRRMRRTHPAVFPLFRLDRIYWDVELEGEAFHVHRSRLARVASDHLPVMVRLRVRRRVATPYVTGDALPPAAERLDARPP